MTTRYNIYFLFYYLTDGQQERQETSRSAISWTCNRGSAYLLSQDTDCDWQNLPSVAEIRFKTIMINRALHLQSLLFFFFFLFQHMVYQQRNSIHLLLRPIIKIFVTFSKFFYDFHESTVYFVLMYQFNFLFVFGFIRYVRHFQRTFSNCVKKYFFSYFFFTDLHLFQYTIIYRYPHIYQIKVKLSHRFIIKQIFSAISGTW